MASWYSNLVTKTTSQISSLKSSLLHSEADGDTEDDTHVARVLRGYYTEKGRAFPPWLPPDPKAPPPSAATPAPALYASQGGRMMGSAGAGPGGGMQQQQQQQGGGLSSLWGDGGGQQQQPQMPQSLRVGRPGVGQRAGSYQSQNSTSGMPASNSPAGGAPGGSAQEKLRQRLWGRTTSPAQTAQQPFQPPGSSGSGGGGGGGGNYEDRFAPGGQYDTGRTYAGANAPWSSEGDGGYGRGGRRGPGLPSGPRGYR